MRIINLFTKLMLTAAVLFTFSCQKNEIDDAPQEEENITTDINGVVQKGPFNVGTTVTLSELNENLSQTGKTFVTQINSDNGSFDLTGIELNHHIMELKADGFYYNEVKDENSLARLSLNAIANVKDNKNLNINVLTHLEKPRVEYLLNNGHSFDEAKAKAKQEVLGILGSTGSESVAAENLDFTKPGEENGWLLALSAIVQGYRNVADVSELLNYIANDLKEDGTLDNAELQTDLISHALFIDPDQIRQNVSNKYADMETSVEIPEFGDCVEQFISTTSYKPVHLIKYPGRSSYGLNILNENKSEFKTGNHTSYSMAAETVKDVHLKIELSLLEGDKPKYGAWRYRSDQKNWDVTFYDYENHKQVFDVANTGQPSDIKISFTTPGKIQIKYIEETRERTRVITIIPGEN